MRSVLVVAWVLLAAACSGTGDDEPAAQPGDEVPGFTEGDFDNLPRLPDSEVLDDPTRQDEGVITATYLVQGPPPRRVIGSMQDRLEADGWNLVEGPTRNGASVRAEFVNERERLEVSAFPATAFEQSYEAATQYSLLLRPSREDPATDDIGPITTQPAR